MLRFAFLFLALALIAALFGFGGIAAVWVTIAKILFYIFLGLFLGMLLASWLAPPRELPPHRPPLE